MDAPICHKGYCVGDPSTNLNGAVEKGLSVLDSLQEETPKEAIFAGSLVVFTDGTDQAGIIHNDVAVATVDGSPHSVFSIGLGGEVDKSQLEALGKSGTAIAEDADQISTAFDEIAQAIESKASRFYVVGYCSPKRAGQHTLNLSVEGFSGEPLAFDFSADGFKAGCDADLIAAPCKNKECGTGEMGLSCGTCEAGVSCVNGKCNETGGCNPDCEAKECGGDGCGGTCGTCTELQSCANGNCVAAIGQFGALCEEESDCADGLCVEAGNERICTIYCVQECPEGWFCAQVLADGSSDITFACLPECETDCEGMECGHDGCGGCCGNCPDNELCSEGICAASGGFDFTPPEVIETVPSDGALGVTVPFVVLVSFSEPVLSATITDKTFVVLDHWKEPVPGEYGFQCGGTVATFTPAWAILPNSEYEVQLSWTIQDLASNTLNTGLVFQFTTGEWFTTGE